jgi:hypothetical protein
MASFELPGSNLNDNLELDGEFEVFDAPAWATNTVIEVVDPTQVFGNETGSEVIKARRSGPARRRSQAHKVSFQPYTVLRPLRLVDPPPWTTPDAQKPVEAVMSRASTAKPANKLS